MSLNKLNLHYTFEWIIFILMMVIQFGFLNTSPVYILDESKFVEAAREMFVSGNYWIPTFNESLFVDKPPMQYFFMMLGFKFFGINAFGARFFSAVFALLTVFFTYNFSHDFFGKKTARATLFVLVSAFFFMQQFQIAVPDPYLIFFCSVALFSFFRYYKSRKSFYLFSFYFLLGLGVLSKGPVAVALPGLSVALFLIFRGELKKVFDYQPFTGLLGIVLIALPWYWLIHIETDGAWTRGFFVVHNLQRFSQAMEGHGGPFFVTLGYVLLGLLPFSFFLPQAFRRALRKAKKPNFLFCLIVGMVFIVFFSASSTKLPNYTMPCYPFLAILLGNYFDKKMDKIDQGWNRLSMILLLLLTLILPIAAVIGLQMDSYLREISYLGYGLIPTAAVSLLATIFLFFKNRKNWFYTIGFGWMLMALILFGYIYPQLNEINPVTQTSKLLGKDKEFFVYQRMDPAFPFNYQRTFPVVNDVDEIEEYAAKHPNAYLMTNIRNSSALDSLGNWKLILKKKSLFEYHFTRIYQKRD